MRNLIAALLALSATPAFGQALPTPTFQTLTVNGAASVSGTLTAGTNGSDAILFKDTLGTGTRFTTSGNNLRLQSAISGGGQAIMITVPSQFASAGSALLTLNNTFVSGGLQFGANVTYTSGVGISTPGSTNPAMLWSQPTLNGTISTGGAVPFQIQVADNYVVSGAGPFALYGFTDNLGTAAAGNRSMLVYTFNKANAASVTGTSFNYVLENKWLHINHGDGGTSTTPLGAFNDINPDILCNSGDFTVSCVNDEHDIRLTSGSNTVTKTIVDLHYGLQDATHASGTVANPTSFTDSALELDAAPSIGNGTGKGVVMIQFGNYGQDLPWDSTSGIGSTLLDVVMNRASNMSGSGQAYIDNGFHMPVVFVRNNLIDNGNFVVTGAGNITSGLATLAATSTGESLDVTGVVEQSATVVSGSMGSPIYVGDELVDAVNGIWQVATKSGANAATVTLVRAAAVATCPASPTATMKFGGGAGITLNITCSSTRNTLALQPSGGAATFGGTVSAASFSGAMSGSDIASGTVSASFLPTATSGALGVVKPDGSTVTVSSGTISVPLASSGVITTSGTYTLPTGWHSLSFKMLGGGGGSGCGIVQSSGTSASGGAAGGTAMRTDGEFISSVTGGTQVVITIGTAGTSCTASGTANGSTGSTATAGNNTTIAIGSFTRTAYGAGAAANGQSANNAGGGAGAGFCGAGGSTTSSAAGTTGGCSPNSANGGTTAAGLSSAIPWGSMGGAGSPNGLGGVGGGASSGPGPGGSGAGLAATQAALGGGAGARAAPLNTGGGGSGGNLSCTGTSQNGGNSAYTISSNWGGSDLTGGGGGGGASCVGSNGGNGGNAAGYGASGGGGGSTSQDGTHVAGSGGTSAGGAVWYVVN